MKTAIIAVVTILLFQGCSKELVYIKPEPFDFQTTEQPKVRGIVVHKDYLKLYEAYITNFRNIINFHNTQISDYREAHDINKTKDIKWAYLSNFMSEIKP